jgi:hypothetical protein
MRALKLLYAVGAAQTYAPGAFVLLVAFVMLLAGASVKIWAFTCLVAACLLAIAWIRLHW